MNEGGGGKGEGEENSLLNSGLNPRTSIPESQDHNLS